MATYNYTSSLPTPAAITPTLVDRSPVLRSPLSGAVQTIARPVYWRLEVEWRNISGDDLRDVQAFWARVQRGDRVNFNAFMAGNRGVWDGTPLVDGGSQTGNTLTIDGASISTTDYGKAGDFFSYLGGSNKRELRMLTVDADSDGSGDVTLEFAPQINSSPDDNEPIDIAGDISGRFVFMGSLSVPFDAGRKLADGNFSSTFSVTLEEDI